MWLSDNGIGLYLHCPEGRIAKHEMPRSFLGPVSATGKGVNIWIEMRLYFYRAEKISSCVVAGMLQES